MADTDSLNNLLHHWQNEKDWETSDGYIHREDRNIFLKHKKCKFIEKSIKAKNWNEYISGNNWGREGNRVHVDLLPIPYAGNLKTAKIVFGLYNPGANQLDYRDEERQDFKAAIRSSIQQSFSRNDVAFYNLDPTFADTSAFQWWEKRLGKLALSLKGSYKYRDLLLVLAKNIAVIELIPYRSTESIDAKLLKAKSSQLAIDAITGYFFPKAQREECLVVLKGNLPTHFKNERGIQIKGIHRNIICCRSTQGFSIGDIDKPESIASRISSFLSTTT